MRAEPKINLICTVVLVFITSCRTSRSDRDILSARCRAKCLSYLKLRRGGISEGSASRKESVTGEIDNWFGCNSDATCSQCLKPCGERFTGAEQCKLGCMDNNFSCVESCEFLKLSMTFKPGTCPAPFNISGFKAACVHACKKDSDCADNRKCCKNTCGKTCVKAEDREDGLPKVPSQLVVRSNHNQVELSWQHKSNDTVVYIVQAKSVRKKTMLNSNDQWKLMVQTIWSPVIFNSLQHGLFYQFRVAAVSIRGSRAFSSPSQVFIRAPERPGPPIDLKVEREQRTGDTVEVAISWQPPSFSPVNVSRYKIFWSRRLSAVSEDLVSLREHSDTVPGSKLTYTMKGLQFGNNYFVQVQAIVKAGSMRAKSSRSSIHVTTFQLATDDEPFTPTRGHPSLIFVGKPRLDSVEVGEPYYDSEEKDLRAAISWSQPKGAQADKYLIRWECLEDKQSTDGAKKAKFATTHESSFTLYGLQYNCQHSVKVDTVLRDKSKGDTSLKYFPTPLCSDVIVIGYQPPHCEHEVAKQKIPRMPQKVGYSVLSLSPQNSSVEIRWSLDPTDMAATEVHVIWGESIGTDTQQLTMVKETASRMVLKRGMSKAVICGLKADKIYLVHLQAVSEDGISHPTAFVVPVSKNPPATTKKTPQITVRLSNTANEHSLSVVMICLFLMMQLHVTCNIPTRGAA